MRIVICSNEDSEWLNAKVPYLDQNKVYRVSAGQLWLNILDYAPADIYFLDMDIANVDPVALGREIRRLQREIIIICFATDASSALNAFCFRPLRFLLKEDPPEKWEEVQRAISEEFKTTPKGVLDIYFKGNFDRVAVDKIMYAEKQGHHTQIHVDKLFGNDGFVEKVITVNESLYALLGKLESEDFLQINRSSFVNYHYIKHMDHEKLYMLDGKELFVSRIRFPIVKDFIRHKVEEGDR